MLINLSNHPFLNWSKKQETIAKSLYTEVIDMPFPHINPKSTTEELDKLVEQYHKKVVSMQPLAIHIMGELVFTYKLVNILKSYNISCIASTTSRNTVEKDGIKTSVFEFIQFRSY